MEKTPVMVKCESRRTKYVGKTIRDIDLRWCQAFRLPCNGTRYAMPGRRASKMSSRLKGGCCLTRVDIREARISWRRDDEMAMEDVCESMQRIAERMECSKATKEQVRKREKPLSCREEQSGYHLATSPASS